MPYVLRYAFEPHMDLLALRAPESSTKAPYIAFVKPKPNAEVSWVMVRGSVPRNYNRDPHPKDFLEISEVHDGYYHSPNSYFPLEWEQSKTVWDRGVGATTLTLHPAAHLLKSFYQQLQPKSYPAITTASDSNDRSKRQRIAIVDRRLPDRDLYRAAYMAGVEWRILEQWVRNKDRNSLIQALLDIPLPLIKAGLKAIGHIKISNDVFGDVEDLTDYEQRLAYRTFLQGQGLTGDFISRHAIYRFSGWVTDISYVMYMIESHIIPNSLAERIAGSGNEVIEIFERYRYKSAMTLKRMSYVFTEIAHLPSPLQLLIEQQRVREWDDVKPAESEQLPSQTVDFPQMPSPTITMGFPQP
ncbi:hypothetical protein, partial [Sansalvadorimonas verongulae]|uniref:hypothetical protein n=1 Tax=Sansalvadorimonas verongulae TaxID=2172824 RepID=UPI0012BC726B